MAAVAVVLVRLEPIKADQHLGMGALELLHQSRVLRLLGLVVAAAVELMMLVLVVLAVVEPVQ